MTGFSLFLNVMAIRLLEGQPLLSLSPFPFFSPNTLPSLSVDQLS
jgi:hypothetical protein